MSFIIGHTSVTSHSTVFTEKEDVYDYGGSTGYASVTDLRFSCTEEEYDYKDDDKDFYKFNEDSVHPDWRYHLNEQRIRASRESQQWISPEA